MASTWRKLRRRRQTRNEQALQDKSQPEELHRTENSAVEISYEQIEESSSRVTTVTQEQERTELSPMEQRMFRLLSRGYRLTQNLKISHLSKFLLFVLSCWLFGLFLGNYMSSNSQVFWFLKDLKLLEYYQSFSALGYERLDDLRWVTDQDLMDVGVKLRSHRLRILFKAHHLEHSSHILSYLICAFFVIQTLMVSVFFACVIFHNGFKQTVKAAVLWSAITVWCRVRIYQRHWRELTATEVSTEIGNENVVINT